MRDPKTDVIKDEAPDSAFAFLRDSFNKLLDAFVQLVENVQSTSGAIAIATTKSKLKTTATIDYSIGGALELSKVATDNLFVLSGAIVADGYTNKYLLMLDASGNASTQEGTAGVDADAVEFTEDQIAGVTAAKKVVGMATVSTVGAAFNPGTTLLDAGTVTLVISDGPPIAEIVRAYKIEPHA